MIYEITRVCPICGKGSATVLSVKEYQAFGRYALRGGLIQDVLPRMAPALREYLRGEGNPLGESGYCHDCMKLLFNRTSDRIYSIEYSLMEMLENLQYVYPDKFSEDFDPEEMSQKEYKAVVKVFNRIKDFNCEDEVGKALESLSDVIKKAG